MPSGFKSYERLHDEGNNNDAGVYLLLILELLYYDLPIIFREEDIEFIRKAFFYHFLNLNGKIPQVRIIMHDTIRNGANSK